MKRLTTVIALSILVLGEGGCVLTHRGLPPESGTLRVVGLRQPVNVFRDDAGIPHIYAQNRVDLARALGYVQAQDRLLQLDLLRRMAAGRLAEAVGREAVELDFAYRILDAEGFAQTTLASYPPEVLAELDAFADGVNAWIDQLGDEPPFLFWVLSLKPSHITPLDVLATYLPLAVTLACNLNEEALYLNLAPRLAPDQIAELLVSPGEPPEPPPAEVTATLRSMRSALRPYPGFQQLVRTMGIAASNNWVVDGSRSASGKPMLANDPHLPQSMPSIWYEAVLCTPEGCTAGAMIVGSPSITIGTNGHVSWGVTNVQADVMDLSIEKLSADGNSYLFRDAWQPVEHREITIHVKGEKDVVRWIKSTRHGPLVGDVLSTPDSLGQVTLHENHAVALRFALPPGGMVGAGIEAARARSGRELVEAYRSFTGGVLNLVWADEQGNIGWHVIGAIPDREGFSGKYPTIGWTAQGEWLGMIPYDKLPHVENPPSHSIVTANDRVTDVPYNGNWMPPWRRDRIAELLAAHDRLTLENFEAIQNDRVSLFARRLKETLIEAGDGGDPDLAWALSELRSWDGGMVGESRAAAICAATQVALPKRVLKPLLGDDYEGLLAMTDWEAYNAAEDLIARPESGLWPQVPSDRADLIRDALKDALAILNHQLGSDRAQWRWDRLHTITFRSALTEGVPDLSKRLLGWYVNRGPFSGAGGRHTVNNGWFDLRTPFKTTQVSSYRLIVDMAHPSKVVGINHTGQSDIPASNHYDDLIDLWRAGQYHVLEPDRSKRGEQYQLQLLLLPGT